MAEEVTETDENFEQILKEIDAEDGSGDAAKPKAEVEEVKEGEEVEEIKESEEGEGANPDSYYPHIEIMEEQGIDRKQLPKEIQDMISTFNRKRVISERRKAADSTFLKIRNLSAVIADRIMDWIEKDMDGEAHKPVVKEGGGGVDDDIVKEVVEEKSEGGIFDGILGGIFNW